MFHLLEMWRSSILLNGLMTGRVIEWIQISATFLEVFVFPTDSSAGTDATESK